MKSRRIVDRPSALARALAGTVARLAIAGHAYADPLHCENRPCHVFPIELQGQAGSFVAGSSSGQSVNSFCIPPTSSDAVKQSGGLAGEGSSSSRTR